MFAQIHVSGFFFFFFSKFCILLGLCIVIYSIFLYFMYIFFIYIITLLLIYNYICDPGPQNSHKGEFFEIEIYAS